MRFWDIVMTAATQGGGAAADPDPLGTALAALEAAGKLVCAWYLPAASPSSTLTLSGADVTAWNASYGTQKVDLASETAAPQWDATLFSNKGGVTFNGSTQRLLGTGNVTNWPPDTDDLYMLVAVASVASASTRRAFAYGNTTTSTRAIGNTVGPVPSSIVAATVVNGVSTISGGSTVGLVCDIGGTSAIYLNGVSDGTASTASGALTISRVRLGASAAGSASQFFQGTISCAAILNSTASLSDFTSLEALMRARVT